MAHLNLELFKHGIAHERQFGVQLTYLPRTRPYFDRKIMLTIGLFFIHIRLSLIF